MHPSTTSTLLLTTLVSAASAFVPMQIASLPTDLDSNVWKPLSTVPAEPAPTAASPSSQPTPTEAPEQILEILPFLDPNMVPDLKKRQGVTQAVAPTAITQVSPVTTYQINLYRTGGVSQLNVVYTQTFNPIPDQWPSPTAAGTIGLGTIQGEIGVVKTKRSLPTQAPLASSPKSTPIQPPTSESIPLLDKLRKLGKDIQQEVEGLLNKAKKPIFEMEEDSSLSLGKELRLPTSGSSEDEGTISSGPPSITEEAFSFGASDDTNGPFYFGGTEADEDELTRLLPEMHVYDNDARVLKAGSLAIIAVAIGTMCVSYL